MENNLYSVAFGPVNEGKPSKVTIVVAPTFFDVVAAFCEEQEILSIQLLPDKPLVL